MAMHGGIQSWESRLLCRQTLLISSEVFLITCWVPWHLTIENQQGVYDNRFRVTKNLAYVNDMDGAMVGNYSNQ